MSLKKPLMAVYVVGSAYLAMAFKLSLLGHTPLMRHYAPKYSLTLQRLEFQSMELEMLKDCLQVLNVFLLCAQMNNDVIQIDQTGQIIQLS